MIELLEFVGADGAPIAADARGETGAPTVLLLHGGGQTRHAWGGTADALAAGGYRAISLDARGHGDSAWDAQSRYRLRDFARDLAAICQQLDATPALVGASLGGSTSMLAVGGMGVVARALVLVDIAPQIEARGVERIFKFMAAHPDGFATIEEAGEAVAGYLPHRKRPDDLSGLAKNLRRRDDGRWRWHWDPQFLDTMRAHKANREARNDVARQLTLPTMLVRGKLSDLLSEEGAQNFLALVPHARYVDVSGATHMVAGDKNDRFTAAVTAFLDETLR